MAPSSVTSHFVCQTLALNAVKGLAGKRGGRTGQLGANAKMVHHGCAPAAVSGI